MTTPKSIEDDLRELIVAMGFSTGQQDTWIEPEHLTSRDLADLVAYVERKMEEAAIEQRAACEEEADMCRRGIT